MSICELQSKLVSHAKMTEVDVKRREEKAAPEHSQEYDEEEEKKTRRQKMYFQNRIVTFCTYIMIHC